jgi:hypothetical protein
MDYTLNINKALKKKLKATQRNRTLQYKYTVGGIVITADAASFELFKMVSRLIFFASRTIIDSMFGMSFVQIYRIIRHSLEFCLCGINVDGM